MHRRAAVVVFAAGEHLEAFFQPGEAATALINFECTQGLMPPPRRSISQDAQVNLAVGMGRISTLQRKSS